MVDGPAQASRRHREGCGGLGAGHHRQTNHQYIVGIFSYLRRLPYSTRSYPSAPGNEIFVVTGQ
jgi:hypothetical protein